MTTTIDLLLESLRSFERETSPSAYPAAGGNWFASVTGRRPVLLSAPHACCHMRDGTEKMGEEYTSALTRCIAKITDCHAIYTTHKSDEDPNWQSDGEYKNALQQFIAQHRIRLVIDIHGMTNRYHMGVALGTINGSSTHGVDVVSPFEQAGFVRVDARDIEPPLSFVVGRPLPKGEGAERHWQRLIVDHPRFTGGVKSHTITRFVSELQVAAVQVEIASVNRIVHWQASANWPFEYHGNHKGITAVVNALTDLVRSV